MTTLQQPINGMWIGAQLSRMELLTIQSFIANGHPFHLWAYEALSTPLPEGCVLHDAAEIIPLGSVFRYENGGSKGSFAGFSDVWRFKFLQDVGGWYVDMDVCCLKPFDYRQDHVIRLNRFNGDPTANIIRLPAGTAFAREYCDLAGAMVTRYNADFYLPLSILGYLVAKHQMQQYFAHYNDFVNLHPNILATNVNGQRAGEIRALEQSWRNLGRSVSELHQQPLELLLGSPRAVHWGNERLHHENVSKNEPGKGSIYAMLLDRYGV